MSEKKEIAAEILNQLGGGRFQAMVGAHNMGYSDDENGNPYLSLKFKGSRKASYLKVILTPLDTYTMEFGRVRSLEYQAVQTEENVYCDQLQDVFTEVTGLYTHL